jgi:threonine dehydrogenase-like Zn-dependent dehydrogenase
MQALTYHGSKDVRVETVPDPRLVEPDDILLRVTATAICGSDLHIHRGKIPMMDSGDILGLSHTLPLEQAAHGDEIFEKKQQDCRKVVLTPQH